MSYLLQQNDATQGNMKDKRREEKLVLMYKRVNKYRGKGKNNNFIWKYSFGLLISSLC